MLDMKIAVIRFSALGDIASLIPFLRALKTRPAMITAAAGKELLKDELDDFMLLESKKLSAVFKLIREIRKRRFDVLIDLQNNDRSRIITALSGAGKIFSNKGMLRGIPAYDDALRILAPSGLLGSPDTTFVPKPHDYIVLNTASSERWKSKRIPDSKWREFAQVLLDRYQLPFVLTGDPSEKEYVSALAGKLPGTVRNMAGKTTLPELKKLLGGAFLTVSTDSAAMHISAAQKTPTIGLFGATNWVRSRPFGPWSAVLYDRTVYPDGKPPVPNLDQPGPYYEQIRIEDGLEQLTGVLPPPVKAANGIAS
jgi:ADP-heptose:LPS heptosyltransferase